MAYQGIFSAKPSAYQVGQTLRKTKSLYDQTPQGVKNVFSSQPVSQAFSAHPVVSGVRSLAKLPSAYESAKSSIGNLYAGYTGKPQQQSTVASSAPEQKPPSFDTGLNYNFPQPIIKKEQPTAQETFMSKFMANAEKQKAFAEQQRKQKEDYLKQRVALSNEGLRSQLGGAEARLAEQKKGAEATIADLLAGGERQKGQARDYYGEAQRLGAQTSREMQGQNQRTFAGLNTLDSRGEGSFGQAEENRTSDFNRFTQQNLRSQADKLAEIDATVSGAVRSAKQTILEQEGVLNDLKSKIEMAIANNNLSEAEQLTQAYNETQQYIYEVEDAVNNMQYQFDLEKEKLSAASGQMSGLSPEFLATGRPTTQKDAEFIFSNNKGAETYAKLLGTGAGGKKTEKQMAYEAAANIAQNALTKLNSGAIQSGFGQKTLGSIGETLGTNSAEQQAYRSDIAAMRTAIQNALLGANMSPKEMEQVMAAIPQYSDDPNIARQKLQSLMTNLPLLAGSGQEVSQPLTSDQLQLIMSSLGE